MPQIADVENILQETFIKALLHYRENMTEEDLTKWLIKIARNTTTSFLRQNKPTESLDDYINILHAPELPLDSIYLFDLENINTSVPTELFKYLILNIKDEVSLLEISRRTNISYERLRYWKKVFIEELIIRFHEKE
jgi:DNA-directed RNA polymerase specialized sigma24 family protein